MGLPIFAVFYFGIFILIIVFAVSSSTRKVKINENISSKYKDEAFRLISNNEELKKERTSHKIRNFLALLAGLAFLSTFIYIMTTGEWKFPLIIGVGILLFLIIIMPKDKDKNSLFRTIIPSILSSYKEDLTYFHKNGFSSPEYREAGFEGYDRFRSDDFIRGKIGNYDFELSEVKTEREYRDKDGHTHYVTVFHGVFARVPLDKEFGCFISEDIFLIRCCNILDVSVFTICN